MSNGDVVSFEALLLKNKNINSHPQLSSNLEAYLEAIAVDGYVPVEEVINAIYELAPTDQDAQAILEELIEQLQELGISLAIVSNGGGSTASVSVVENSTVVTTVLAIDPQADVVGYSIVGGADAALFQINSATGELTFIDAPDFEAPNDANSDGIYDVIVQASDSNSNQIDTQTLQIVVTDTNEAPTLASAAINAVEDGPSMNVDLAALGDDVDNDDDGTTLDYAIVTAPGEGTATISDTTLSFDPGMDFQDLADGETRDVVITISAMDAQGAVVQNDVTVTVTGTNDVQDLPSSFGILLNRVQPNNFAGSSVSSAGDVNGDGIADIIIGAPSARSNGVQGAGQTYVVFGSEDGLPSTINLEQLNGTNGFVLNGIDFNDQSGSSVSSAGDVNGDGIDDILIGAWPADPDGVSRAGETYVIFGRDTATQGSFASSIDLDDLDGTNGFVINGINIDDLSGRSVSSAGDINGDGIDDILIGAANADPGGVDEAGETYIVFGRDTAVEGDFAAAINLETLDGTNGFVLNGIASDDLSGTSVSAVGDVNGDGIDDIIVGGSRVDPNGLSSAGAAYVIFGKNTADEGNFAASIDLEALDGENGFVLNGIASGDETGVSVSSAGDVNGDGIDDLVVGAWRADPNGISTAGETYVVFGQDTAVDGNFAASIDLTSLDGSNGFVLNGSISGGRSGSSVSSAGDFNGDGIDDILIGAEEADADGITTAGVTYVVFGKDTAAEGDFASAIDLGVLDGSDGFVFYGVAADDRSGSSVSSAGDINGDGICDILIGAPRADPDIASSNAGAAYVVYGGIDLLLLYDAADGVSDGAIDLALLSGDPSSYLM